MLKIPASHTSFQIPETAAEWQLNESMEGVERVAADLTEAMAKMCAEMSKMAELGYAPYRVGGHIMMSRFMLPVMNRYKSYGATDTKVRTLCYDIIDGMAVKLIDRPIYR